MYRGGTAPVAILFELYLALNQFFVFGAPIIDTLAFATLEFDESILGHMDMKLTKGL